MAKNKNESNNNQNQKTNETEEVVTEKEVVAEEKKDNGGGEKKNKDSNSFTSVCKIDMQCEGCATKIKQCVKDFQGVDVIKLEVELNKLTVVGEMDPTMLRDKLSQKRKKDVMLISPLPSKDNKAAADDNKPDKKPKDKKPKEAPVKTSVLKGTMDVKALAESLRNMPKRPVEIVPASGFVSPLPPKDQKPKENKNHSSNNNREVVAEEKKDNGGGEKKNEDLNSVTAVYKIEMHCKGCVAKIKRCARCFQGVEDVKTETGLNKLTVVGKMDPTELRDMLSRRTKKPVEIVTPKKEKYGGGSSREDFDKKDGNGGGSAGGKKGGGGDGGQEEGGGGENRMDVFRHPGFGYYDHGYGYGNGFVNGYGHANGREWEWICARISRTRGCSHGWALATCPKYVQ